MNYTGNRLQKITDSAPAVTSENSSDYASGDSYYSYDSSGRMTSNSSRKISKISYNHLDLPVSIEFLDGNYVTYAYSAMGRKLMTAYTRQLPSGERTDYRYYCDGAEFVKNGAGALGIGRYNTAWGYVDGRGSLFVKMKDYQGNIRAVVSSSGTVVKTTDYYPYGMPMQSSTGAEVNRYKYGAKEFETEDGLNQYDFEARTQLPQTALFTTPDPKAGDYPSLNPYLYCAANPIKYIDPSGERLYLFDRYGSEAELQFKGDSGFLLVDKNGEEINESDYSLAASDFMKAIAYLSQSETATSIINNIIDSKENVYVNCSQDGNSFDPKTNTVSWDPSNTIGGPAYDMTDYTFTRTRPSAIGLSHELAHVEDRLKGTFNNEPWVTYYDYKKNPVTLVKAELYAVTKENLIRRELKQPIRVAYASYLYIDRAGMSHIVTQGKTIFSSNPFIGAVNVKPKCF